MTDALVAVLSVVLFAAFLALWSSCSAPAARRAVHDGHPTDDPQAGVRFTFLGTSRSSSADRPSRRGRHGGRIDVAIHTCALATLQIALTRRAYRSPHAHSRSRSMPRLRRTGHPVRGRPRIVRRGPRSAPVADAALAGPAPAGGAPPPARRRA